MLGPSITPALTEWLRCLARHKVFAAGVRRLHQGSASSYMSICSMPHGAAAAAVCCAAALRCVQWAASGMVVVWGVRLGTYLVTRIMQTGKDAR